MCSLGGQAKSGDYGEEVPHRAEFDAPVGRALSPTVQQNGTSIDQASGCWVREFSHGVVVVNANKGLQNSTLLSCSLMLDLTRFSYKDVYGRQVEGLEVVIAPNDAAILLRENRTTGMRKWRSEQ